MSTKVAINGLGRIGRAILKLVIDEPELELVAVNDLAEIENLAYLLRFDTVYGRYSKSVAVDGGHLVVDGRKLRTLKNRDPAELPWKELGSRARVRVHRRAQASRGSGEAHSGRRSVRHPVGAFTRRGGGDRRARRERSARRSEHHLLRELHDELHHADRRGHRPAHWVQEGDDDDRTRLHFVAVDRRRAEQELPSRSSRGGESRARDDGCRTRDDPCAARIRRSVRWDRDPCAASCRVDRGPHVCHLAADQRRGGEPDPHGGSRNDPLHRAYSACPMIRSSRPTSLATRAPPSSISSSPKSSTAIWSRS